MELWCLLHNNRYPHKIGLFENYEESVGKLLLQSAAIRRDDNYFVVRVSHTTDI